MCMEKPRKRDPIRWRSNDQLRPHPWLPTIVREAQQSARQTRLGGTGENVAAEIETRLKRETRTVVLGRSQRGGAPTPFDRALAM